MQLKNLAPNPVWVGKVLIGPGQTRNVEAEDYGHLADAAKAKGAKAEGFAVAAKFWVEEGLEVIRAPTPRKKKKEAEKEAE